MPFFGTNAKTSHMTKHIDVNYNFVSEYTENGTVKIVFIRSKKMTRTYGRKI